MLGYTIQVGNLSPRPTFRQPRCLCWRFTRRQIEWAV